MDCVEIRREDYEAFHALANAYYREGEDADTPQEEIDGFIRLLFSMVSGGEISGCFVKQDAARIGFALWAVDTEAFAFSELPGLGTILEIGLHPKHRSAGLGKELVSYVENRLRGECAARCYVSAYGPAQEFWKRCGYAADGRTAQNGLPIMIKSL